MNVICTNRMLGILRLVGLLVIATVCQVSMAADRAGTYSASVNVKTSGRPIKLDYTMYLEARNKARLEIKRTGEIDVEGDDIRGYGEQLNLLESLQSIELRGRWDESNDDVFVTFEQIRSGDEADERRIKLHLVANRTDLTSEDWNEDFFGTRSMPTFKKGVPRGNKDLAVGLAILAAGAILLDSNSHSHSRNELNVDTNGIGNVRFANDEKETVSSMRFLLKNDGDCELSARGSFNVTLIGKWKKTDRGYSITFRNASVDNQSSSSVGTGILFMKNDRRDVTSFTGSFTFKGDRRVGSLTFTAYKG